MLVGDLCWNTRSKTSGLAIGGGLARKQMVGASEFELFVTRRVERRQFERGGFPRTR
jgi:hypothetical protein